MSKYWNVNGELIEIFDADDIAEKVRNTIGYLEAENDKLRKENKKTHEEVVAEIQNEFAKENYLLKEELKFSIAKVSSTKELEDYNLFVKEHIPCRSSKATGGAMPIITQFATGIGTCTKLQCPVCLAEKDITDIDAW